MSIQYLQAAKILGPPTTFNAAKLKVEFAGVELRSNKQPPPFPGAYTLTHCDFTANLTLAVSGPMTSEQLAVDAAEGRRGGRVEGGDYRQQQQRRGEGDDAAVLSYNPYFSDSQNIVFACFFAKLTRCIASSAAPTSCRSWPQVSDTTSSPESCRWYVVRRCLHSNSNYNQPE